MESVLFSIRTLTAMHCGVGQGANDIDLPVARHPVSGHPLIPGSSIKGVMKDEFLNTSNLSPEEEKLNTALFGGTHINNFASAISLSDGIMLCLPVRSFYGTFAYLSSPYTLQIFKNQSKRVQPNISLPSVPLLSIADPPNTDYKAIITTKSMLKNPNDKELLLEELDLPIDGGQKSTADEWANVIADLFFGDDEGRRLFTQRFAIVDDNVLNFIAETALPVDARIAIDDETGTAQPGALWYEETVPPETLFTGVITVDRSFYPESAATPQTLTKVLTDKKSLHCQIEGKSTTGKGFSEVKIFSNFDGAHKP